MSVLQPGNEARKGGIKGGNAIRKVESVGQEASDYLSGLALVNFHRHSARYVELPRLISS